MLKNSNNRATIKAEHAIMPTLGYAVELTNSQIEFTVAENESPARTKSIVTAVADKIAIVSFPCSTP
jgi:hypothetical protein